MNDVYLSPEGVFPLADPCSSLGLPCSGTLQGEGLLIGVPSLFVRVSGCNLRCRWTMRSANPGRNSEGSCSLVGASLGSSSSGGGGPEGSGRMIACDTPWALDRRNGTAWKVVELAELISRSLGALRHIVITGGEPLLQAEPLTELIRTLRATNPERLLHFTLETNGTLFDPALAEVVDLVSLSPKLEPIAAPGYSPIVHDEYVRSLNAWIASKKEFSDSIQLKFVVSSGQDEGQIDRLFLSRLKGLDAGSVMVMPASSSREEHLANSDIALSLSVRRGWRYAPRLQLLLWDRKSGV